MTTCDYCQHVEMCGWRKELNEQGCEFYDDGNRWRNDMTREKALILALKIVDVCKTYGGEDRCRQCPFNVNGCFVTDGNNIPTDWRASELIKSIEMKGGK